jgi:hypothetical protein
VNELDGWRRNSINYMPELMNLMVNVKKTRAKNIYAYMTYDLNNINFKDKARVKCRDALDIALVPRDLDAAVLGKKYSQDDVLSTILTQVSRYSGKAKLTPDPGWVKLKLKLADHFARRYFKGGRVRKQVSAEIISRHMKPVIEKMVKNGGIFQDLNVQLADKTKTFSIHFFLKEIVKCVMAKAIDADKCGQGISAWSKTLNSLFCPLFRAIEECFKESLKETVIFENGMKEEEFDAKISAMFEVMKQTFVNDFKEYDSRQNADTQFFEDVVLWMFVPETMIELYRAMRLGARQKSVALSLFNEAKKNSGEAATLFTNTVLNMMFVSLITKVTNVRCEGYKGDDSFINADKVELFNWVTTWSEDVHVPMQSDIDFPIHADFVGYWLSPFGLIPDILKILCKMISKDYGKKKGYVEELKLSINDKEKFLTYEKVLHLRKIYADVYNIGSHQFNMLLSTWEFARTDLEVDSNRVGFAALYDNDNIYAFDDLTEAQKNQKRVKQMYGDTTMEI